MKNKALLLSTMLLCVFLHVAAPAPALASSNISFTGLETFVGGVIQDQLEESGIPGAIVSVVQDGEVLFSQGYGYADLSANTVANSEETLFRIGSVSKLITWTAVMQMVEQGELELDEDINTYLDFSIPSRLEHYPYSGEPAPITLRHLMTHTAGFEDVKENLFFLDETKVPKLADFLKNNVPLRVFPPGEMVAYSNYGAALAGYIVQQVSGLSFADYVEKNIYQPLDMNRSTFAEPLPYHLSPAMARASRYVNEEFYEDSFVYVSIGPAGSMSTTANDMAKFMAAHLQGGSGILTPESIELMHSQQFTHHSLLDGMAFGFVESTVNEQRVLFHGGDIFAFQSGLFLLPEHNVGLFVSYSGGTYNEPLQLLQEFMNQYFPSLHTTALGDAAGTTAKAKAFAGEYHPNRKNFSTAESLLSLMEGIQVSADKDGYLTATLLGEISKFVEIEPGVYRTLREGRSPSPFGAFNTLVFKADSFGRTMLFTDGKVSYSKAPWYATSSFTFLAIILVLLLSLVTLTSRAIRFAINLVRRRRLEQSKGAVAARWLNTGFGLTTIGYLMAMVSSIMQIHPIFGQPLSAFGIFPAWSWLLDVLPVLMLLIGLGMVPFAVIVWLKGYWRKSDRVYYTAYTALSLVLLWVFSYWNLLS